MEFQQSAGYSFRLNQVGIFPLIPLKHNGMTKTLQKRLSFPFFPLALVIGLTYCFPLSFLQTGI